MPTTARTRPSESPLPESPSEETRKWVVSQRRPADDGASASSPSDAAYNAATSQKAQETSDPAATVAPASGSDQRPSSNEETGSGSRSGTGSSPSDSDPARKDGKKSAVRAHGRASRGTTERGGKSSPPGHKTATTASSAPSTASPAHHTESTAQQAHMMHRRVCEPEPGSNLFVAGLAPTVDDDALERTFAPFGNVLSAKVMLRVATGVSRGFGFVLFEKAAEAEAARKATHGAAIEGHGGRLQVSVSKHRGENLTAESRVVFVRNVPAALVDTDTLRDFLATIGRIDKVTVRPNPPPSTVTTLVLLWSTVEAARACVHVCHGKSPFPECAVPLMAKMEEPLTLREQRRRGEKPQGATDGKRASRASTSAAAAEGPLSSSSGAQRESTSPTPGSTSEVRENGSPSPAPGVSAAAAATTSASPTPYVSTAAARPFPGPWPPPLPPAWAAGPPSGPRGWWPPTTAPPSFVPPPFAAAAPPPGMPFAPPPAPPPAGFPGWPFAMPPPTAGPWHSGPQN